MLSETSRHLIMTRLADQRGRIVKSLPLAAFADAIVMGEGEGGTEPALRTIGDSASRAAALLALAEHPNIFVPEHHADQLARIAACDDALLPATSTILTPHTELSNMFLI